MDSIMRAAHQGQQPLQEAIKGALPLPGELQALPKVEVQGLQQLQPAWHKALALPSHALPRTPLRQPWVLLVVLDSASRHASASRDERRTQQERVQEPVSWCS